MKLLHRFIYFTMMCIILTAFVGCPVEEPDDTVKITDLQTAIDKADNNAVLTLSDYPDITNYTATINKPLTIVGATSGMDLGGSTLTITVSGVTVQKVSKTNIVITSDVGNGSCTIIGSSLANLTVSGCGMINGSLILDNTKVTSATFDKSVETNEEYVGLILQNDSDIVTMIIDTSVAIKTDSVFDARNEISSLEIKPQKNTYAAVSVLPEYRYDIADRGGIVCVNFYDPLLEDNEVKARIDVLVKQSDANSTVQRDFLIQTCRYLLGNVMDKNVQSVYLGSRIESDISEPIQNMVDTVKITFHNNLEEVTTDIITVITKGAYSLPTATNSIRPPDDSYTLYGWTKTLGSNTKDYNFGQTLEFRENTTLYAVWRQLHTISYRDRGVSGDVTFDAWIDGFSPQLYYFADDIVDLPSYEDIAKNDYIFRGWYEDFNYTGSEIKGWKANQKDGNVTLYAKWEYCAELKNISFRSDNGKMTVKWLNPNDANIEKVKITLNNGEPNTVTVTAGQPDQKEFTGLTNGTEYTAILTAIDNKGNESQNQAISNYCGSYIGTDGSLYIKGTNYEKTAMKTVIDTTTDVTGDGSEGVFINGRTVTLSPYCIGKYEVTQQLYQTVMGSNPSSHSGAMLPVEQVSRSDCMKMCRKLNEIFGYENTSSDDVTVDLSKEGFRLPTEAEWEFAARGGNTSVAAWSYQYSGNNSIDTVAWYSGNANKSLNEVGTKDANALDIYDMSGNVWEWVADNFTSSISSGTVTNPLVTIGDQFVQRGGGYGSLENFCQVDTRISEIQSQASKYCGFRLAINGVVR